MDNRDLLENNESYMISTYEQMPARDIRERMENIYDLVRDTLNTVTLPVRLPVALTQDLFVGIFGRHYAGNKCFTAELMSSNTRWRATQRYLSDLEKAGRHAEEKLKQDKK